MKKYLLAGTSAFALALTAGAAKADSTPGKFDIKISGDAYFEAGLISQSHDTNQGAAPNHNTSGDFINRLRLQINPEAKADNGLTYGAKVRIRANASDGRVDGDKAYIYMSGAFGEVQGGVVYGPSDSTYVGHPADWQMLGAYDQWKYYVTTQGGNAGAAAGPTTATTTLANNAAGPGNWAWGQFGNGSSGVAAAPASEGMQLLHSHDIDTKLVYYTPRFLGSSPTTGLQGAVSYAPHVGSLYDGGVSVNTGVSRSSLATSCITDTGVSASLTSLVAGQVANCQQVTAFRDVFEVTANYNEKFGDWMVKGSLGYEGGKAMADGTANATTGLKNSYNDLNSFQVGVQVGWRDIVVGGGFVDNFKSGYRKQNSTAAHNDGAGALTAPAPTTTDQASDQTAWNVGAQYTWGPAVLGVKYFQEKDAGDLLTAGGRTLDSVTAGGMYTIAPGLRTGLEYTYFSAKSDLILDPNAAGTSKKQTGSVVLLRSVVSF